MLIIRGDRFVECNNAVVEMLGYRTREEFLNTHPSDLSPPIQPDGRFSKDKEEELMELAAEIGSLRFEWTHSRADGSTFPVAVSLTSIPSDGDRELHVVWRDITDQKTAEEALRKSEQRFRTLADNVPGVIYLCRNDERYTMVYLNDKVEELTGYKKEKFLSDKLSFVEIYHPDDLQDIYDQVDAALAERRPFHLSYRLRHRSGEERWVEEWGTGIFQNDELQFLEGFMADATARHRAEEEKLNLERQVQHAQKLESLGVLAGGIAHDFNNLLMGILGNADLAMDELPQSSPARSNLAEIEKASKRAADLARQMLAYSGRGQFLIEPIDLNEVVRDMAHLLEVSISKKAVLKFNFAENLPTFDGDMTQIRQIIMNLITNASEALGDSSGAIAISTGARLCDRDYLDMVGETLRATLDEPLAEGVYLFLEVQDTGCGMDKVTIERVFDPFYTTKFTGRGLGMSAVLGIVRGHRGAINVYSEEGNGTTFRVLLPANVIDEQEQTAVKTATEVGGEWHGSGTILVADDEETVRTVGTQMLSRMGFETITARDGREAIEIMKEHGDEIRCVLLDLTMPHVDGAEAFQEIKHLKPDVRVILCSGYNEQDATKRFGDHGLAGFIQKPYSMSALREKLRDILPV